MSLSSRDWRGAVLVSATLALASSVSAAEISKQISVGGRVLAGSNPLLLQDGSSAVLVEGSIAPSLTFGTAGVSELTMAGILIGRQYSRVYGNFILGSATATGVLRDSERLTLTGLASYNRDLAADTIIDIGSAVAPRGVRNAIHGRASAAWRPNPIDTLTPQIDYERVTFEDAPQLAGIATLTGDLAYSRRLDERTSVGLRTTVRDSRAGATDRFTTLAAFMTGERQLSPVWRLSGAIGAERLEQRGVLPPGVQRVRTNFSGSGRLCADGSRVTGCLDLGLANEASPLGGLQRRYTIGASAGYDLNQSVRVVASVEHSTAESGQQSTVPLLGGTSARVQLDWRASRLTLVTADIEYRRRQVGAGFSTDGVFAGIGLRWGTR